MSLIRLIRVEQFPDVGDITIFFHLEVIITNQASNLRRLVWVGLE